jgi:hypothetical protein
VDSGQGIGNREQGTVVRAMAALVISACVIGLAGCAKFPAGGVKPTGKQLVITMTVAGQINPNYYYFVAIDNENDPTSGPLPVIGTPWGNGWGTGALTSFVRYDRLQPQAGYGVYAVKPRTSLLGSTYVGPPINVIPVNPGSNTLRFTIDFSQIETATIRADQISQLNINFITTDVVPLDPNYPGPKLWDALGPAGSDYITISTQTNRKYQNSDTQLELAGDVPNPDLDIIDWSVEVQGF